MFAAVDYWFAVCYAAALAGLLLYKSYTFIYPPWVVLKEMLVLLELILLEAARVAVIGRGLLLRGSGLLTLSTWLATPTACVLGYHLNFQ
eukprot:6461525-Amphidinium_carterae.2